MPSAIEVKLSQGEFFVNLDVFNFMIFQNRDFFLIFYQKLNIFDFFPKTQENFIIVKKLWKFFKSVRK